MTHVMSVLNTPDYGRSTYVALRRLRPCHRQTYLQIRNETEVAQFVVHVIATIGRGYSQAAYKNAIRPTDAAICSLE